MDKLRMTEGLSAINEKAAIKRFIHYEPVGEKIANNTIYSQIKISAPTSDNQ